MQKHHPNMWPGGRLNRRATTAQLQDERAWQVTYQAECLELDGKGSCRAVWAAENIVEIDRELARREGDFGGTASAFVHEPIR